MDSESETDVPEEDLESESESEESWVESVRECWEAVAGLMRQARGMGKLEALD